MRTLLFLFLSLISQQAFPQKGLHMPANNRVIVNFIDHAVHVQFLPTGYRISTDNELHYYWYSNNDIKRTRGGYAGKLLHGPYTDFYPNKNLREKGQFRYGLKWGEWKSWYLNGEYKEIVHWKKGGYQGKFWMFDEQGNLTREGRYENDKWEGKIKEYDSEGKVKKLKYRNGELIVRNPKKRLDKSTTQKVNNAAPKRKKSLGIFGRKKENNKDSLTIQQPSPDTTSRKRGVHRVHKKKGVYGKDSLVVNPSNGGQVPILKKAGTLDSTTNHNSSRKRNSFFLKKKKEEVAPTSPGPVDMTVDPPKEKSRKKKKKNG